MSKKDYENIVRALREARAIIVKNPAFKKHERFVMWAYVMLVDQIMMVLEDDNPRFDRDRFIDALNQPEAKQ